MRKKLLILGLITVLGGAAFASDDNTDIYTVEMLKAENTTLKEKLANTILKSEDSGRTELIKQGDQGENWQISARTYIENELYSGYDGFHPSENIFMVGTGLNAVRGKWGYHLMWSKD